MAGIDRRLVAPLLLPFFPIMEKATSDEWHGFLNAKTGLNIDPGESNATAFDKWRMALAAQHGLPVWGYSAEKIAEIKRRGEELKKMEDDRVKALPDRLAALAKEAPAKTAAQLIADTKAAAKQ